MPVEQGFHPLKKILRFVAQIYFRFVGAVIRFFVIVLSALLALFIFIAGIPVVLSWLLFPLLLPATLAGLLIDPEKAVFLLPLNVGIFTVALIFLTQEKASDLRNMNMNKFIRQKFFDKVIQRMGADPGKISKKTFLDKNDFSRLLKKHGLTKKDFDLILDWELNREVRKKENLKFWKMKNLKKADPVCKHWHFGYTPVLNEIGEEITKKDYSDYGQLELVNYKRELEMLAASLSRSHQNNSLLVGPAGIGKSSIIHYLSKLISRRRLSPLLNQQRVIVLDLLGAVSAANQRRQNAENFMHRIFLEAAYAGNVILVVKNIDILFKSRGPLVQGAVSVLLNYLSLPGFRLIATSDKNNYHKIIENKASLLKHFEVIQVNEPSKEDTAKMIMQYMENQEKNGIIFPYPAIKEIIEKSDQIGKINPLPGRAIGLADKVLTYYLKNPEEKISPELADRYIALKTGVPQGKISPEEKGVLLNLEKIIHKRVIGQDEAVKKVAEAIRQSRTGVNQNKRPVGSFLFLGPTGVGKTETAKALAEAYYGDENRMIRFDMNEYSSQASVTAMIGSQEKNIPGRLTNKVKDHPFSVILLDELEKCHVSIADLFFQVLDEGYITDSFGEKINFKGNIIIATSNAGSGLIRKMIQKKEAVKKIKDKLLDHLVEENYFRVEFLNRFDDVIFFEPFNEEQLEKVTSLMLHNFIDKLKERNNLEIEMDGEIAAKVIEKGYDKRFGARSIRRYINSNIKSIVSKKILESEKRPDKIKIYAKDLQ